MNSNTSNVTVNEQASGGLTRVSFSRGAEADGATAGHQARMLEASSRVQTLDAKTTYTAATTRNDASAVSSSGRITNAQSQAGMPRAGSQIDEDSIITVDGVQLRIADAIRAGIVFPNQDGSFSLRGKA